MKLFRMTYLALDIFAALALVICTDEGLRFRVSESDTLERFEFPEPLAVETESDERYVQFRCGAKIHNYTFFLCKLPMVRSSDVKNVTFSTLVFRVAVWKRSMCSYNLESEAISANPPSKNPPHLALTTHSVGIPSVLLTFLQTKSTKTFQFRINSRGECFSSSSPTETLTLYFRRLLDTFPLLCPSSPPCLSRHFSFDLSTCPCLSP